MTKNRGRWKWDRVGPRTVTFPIQSLSELSASNERSYGLTYDRIHSKETSLNPWNGGNFLVVENTAKEIYRGQFPNRFPNSKRNSMEKWRYNTSSQKLIGQQQTLSASAWVTSVALWIYHIPIELKLRINRHFLQVKTNNRIDSRHDQFCKKNSFSFSVW